MPSEVRRHWFGLVFIENWVLLRYLYPMNKQSNPKLAAEWTDAPAADDEPVVGYEAWLAADVAAGLAEIAEGKITPLADVRKEFGLE